MAPTPTAVRSGTERFYDRASITVLLLMVLIATLTYRDYGVTWDETFHVSYGFHITRFWTTLFSDQTAVSYRIDYLYGGGYDALANMFRAIARPLERYESVHLFGSMVGILGVAGTWRLGRQLGGPRAGLIATLVMGTTAVYYGHMFNNPKDLPFAAGYAWGLYFLFRYIEQLPRVPRSLAIKTAIAFGLAMSVRIGGLLLVCYFALAIGLWCLHQAWVRRSAEHGYQLARKIIPRSVGIVVGAWVVMLVWWPWAMFDPIKRPLAALTRMAEFIDHRRWMPFAGEEVYNLDPPWDYLVHYFVLKMPEYVVVVFIFISAFGLAWFLSENFRRLPFSRRLILFLLAVSIWFPPVYAVYKESPLYDGLRHFLFIIPPIVGAVALAMDRVLDAAAKKWGRSGLTAGWVVIAVLVGDQASTMARLHPHQYVYFNRFIGGLEGAVGEYSTDYYAETYKESAEKMATTLWQTERETYLESVYAVGGCIGQMRAMRHLPANFKWKPEGRKLDLSIGYTRGGCSARNSKHPIVATVERDGGLLNLSRDHRKVMVNSKDFEGFKFDKFLKERKKKKGKKKKGKGKKGGRPRPKAPKPRSPTKTLPPPGSSDGRLPPPR